MSKKPLILLATGMGVYHNLLYPYKYFLNKKKYRCTIVKNNLLANQSIKKYSSEIEKLCENEESVIIIGFSYGGAAALLAAEKLSHIDTIKKIYTIASPLMGVSEPIIKFGKLVTRFLPKNFQQHLNDFAKESTMLHTISQGIFPKKDITNYYHPKDLICTPEYAIIDGALQIKSDYQYSTLLRPIVHQLYTIDPRVFKNIFERINKEYERN